MDTSLIAKKRMELNLSQQELADRAGVSLHTVFRAEKGNNVNTSSIQAIAAALNTKVAYLIGETDEPERADKPKDDFIDPDDIRPAGELIALPVYDLRACAGLGTSHMFEEPEIIGERILERSVVGSISASPDRRPFIVRVSGDSMSEAGIRDGDEVVVNPVQDVYSGDAAMVRFGEDRDTAIKWVYFLPGGVIELRSATPGFPVYSFTREQQLSEEAPMEIVGRVMVYTGMPKRG
jgi:SOS-response transcriptional repressor LexA